MRQMAFFLALVLTTFSAAAAQSGGQFCVKAFEDRNGNGVQDAGEPVLTRGLSINLLNEGGVVVQSAVLENSTRAAFGEYCFQFLEAGQYSVVVSGADYTATTPDTMTAAVSESGAPVVMQFGGRRAVGGSSTAAPVVTAAQQQEQMAQLVVAGLGALLVIAMMAVVGVIVYLAAFHGRLRAAASADARRTTGSMRTVRATDTGELPEEEA